jgi:DnaK suppressor protein
MDEDQARARLTAERAEVERLLRETEAEARTWQEGQFDEPADPADPAQTLTAEDMADAVTSRFRDRIAAINRALRRLDDGTYGRSVRSGQPIPEERLDADPAAELTIEEAQRRG